MLAISRKESASVYCISFLHCTGCLNSQISEDHEQMKQGRPGMLGTDISSHGTGMEGLCHTHCFGHPKGELQYY